MRSGMFVSVLTAFLSVTVLGSQSGTFACNNSPLLCSRPYNNVTYLGAHDSPFVRDATTNNSISGDQFYNTTAQLSAGVRLVTAQVFKVDGTQLQLCHTNCILLNAGRLVDWLQAIHEWMTANPDEVVTILLVNADSASAEDLEAAYREAGVADLSYTPESQSAVTDWPTLGEMIQKGTRLVTFVASLANDDAATYLLDQYTYVFENSYNNTNFTDYSCEPDAPTSVQGDITKARQSGLMPLQNHFLYDLLDFGIEVPSVENINVTNSPSNATGSLGLAAEQCSRAYGRPASFLVVDFFNRGPAIDVADRLNGVTDAVGRTPVEPAMSGQTQSSNSSSSSDQSPGASGQNTTSSTMNGQDQGKKNLASSTSVEGTSFAMLCPTILVITWIVT